MKIGIFTILYNDRPFEDVLKHVSSLGYEAVEVAAWRGSTHIDLDKILSGGAGEYKKKVEEYGLIISSLSNHLEGQVILTVDRSTDEWCPPSVRTPEEKVRYGTDRLKKTIEAASALDLSVINSFTGCPEFGKFFPFPPANIDIWESYWELFKDRWLPILDYAKDHGVRIAFETHPTEMNYNLDTAKRLVKESGNHPSAGFNYDPSHLIWQQMDPALFIYELHEKIFHVHAKDVECVPHSVARTGVLIPGPWSVIARPVRFRTIGWGQVPWRRVVTALSEVGYDYVMSVEHEDPTMSRDSGVSLAIEYLKPLLKIRPPEVKPWW